MPTPRSILITGCSSGIGYAAAHALRGRGWRVFAACRKPEDCARLAAENLETVELDYTSAGSITAAVAHVMAATGGTLDALFNNGAYGHRGAVEDIPREDILRAMETNFIGWWDLTNRVLPAMRRQKAGRIVNCSSVVGYLSIPFSAAYNSTKFAVEAWSDALRIELRDTGIRVSLIEPGPIRTRFGDNARRIIADRIDVEASAFSHFYRRELDEAARRERRTPFQQGPEAVVAALVHALESPSPRSRYRVTLAAHVAAWLKPIVPTSLADWLLFRIR